jgi:hypothetical protein
VSLSSSVRDILVTSAGLIFSGHFGALAVDTFRDHIHLAPVDVWS